jgi:hypothetical protein
MRYLMLVWADADAAGGDESDFRVWAHFDEQVKAAGAFVLACPACKPPEPL